MENNINEEDKEKSYKQVKSVFFNSSMDSNTKPLDIIASSSSSNDGKIQRFHNNKKNFKSNSRRSPNKRFKSQKKYNQNSNQPKKYRYFKSKQKYKNEKILFESELDINRNLETIEIPFLNKISIDQISNDKFKIYYNNFEIKSKNPKVNAFKNIQLNSQIEDNLSTKLEYNMMTPLQKSVIPLILSKKNLLICDDHNTGKTFSYLVSIISIIQNDKIYLENRNKEICCPVCIALFPNKQMIELAYLESQFIAYKSNVFISKIYNTDKKEKISKDEEDDYRNEDNSKDYLNCDILLGTPESILNLFEKKLIKLTRLQYFIIDQFDDIVSSNQIDKVDSILGNSNIPQEYKNYMKYIIINTNLTQEVIKYTEELTFLLFYLVSSKPTDNLVYSKRNIKQQIFEVEEEDKVAKLHEIFQEIEGNAIIFMDRKRRVDELEVFLEERNYNVVAIHGAKVPKKKNIAIKLFSSGEVPILISTDILDSDVELPNVSYIFNFDMPSNIEDYIFRIEKIGRWNNEGTSFSFVNKSNMNIIPDLALLLKKMGDEIPEFLFNYIKNPKKLNMIKGIEEAKNIGGKKNKNKYKETHNKEKGEEDIKVQEKNDEKDKNADEELYYGNNNYKKYNNYYSSNYNNYNYGYNYINYNNYSYNNYYYYNGRENRFSRGYGYNNNYYGGGKYKNNYYGNNKSGDGEKKYEVIEKEVTEKIDLNNNK